MKVGILGTGAIANKHAQAYRNIGFEVVACSNKTETRGREFAERWGAEFMSDYGELCRSDRLDYIDLCTFPDFHLAPVRICTEIRRPILVQKPIATNLADASEMLRITREAGITFGVVSQHRFDDSTMFLKRAIQAGRLGSILQADAYVKWFRNDDYYSRPVKGSWQTEGGGALINQGIHQVDVLQYLIGPVASVCANWQIGALHKIESEDIVNAVVTYQSGAQGVIQASTAFWPGYPERIEIHGTKGSAIITGDRLTSWDIKNDDAANSLDPAPLASNVASGASDPMSISLTPFERQFEDFAEAIRASRQPLVDGLEGYRALATVLSIYESCRENKPIRVFPDK